MCKWCLSGQHVITKLTFCKKALSGMESCKYSSIKAMEVSRTTAEMGLPLLATEEMYSSLISSISFCAEGEGTLDGEGGPHRSNGRQVGELGVLELRALVSSCPCPVLLFA